MQISFPARFRFLVLLHARLSVVEDPLPPLPLPSLQLDPDDVSALDGRVQVAVPLGERFCNGERFDFGLRKKPQ